MISKARAKFIKSLQLKKYRKESQLFVVEGLKSVLEVLGSDFEVVTLVASEQFLNTHQRQIDEGLEVLSAKPKELGAMGSFQTNDQALAVVKMKENTPTSISDQELVLALDEVNDPGNLGTILRVADWYGIDRVIASLGTADLYNPKVIAASKGLFLPCSDLLHRLEGLPGECRGACYRDVHGGEGHPSV